MATYAEQLASVQAAITQIEAGAQSVTFENRTVTYADIRTLYARETRLQAKADRETRGGVRVRGATPIG